jgi:hypothetical protein
LARGPAMNAPFVALSSAVSRPSPEAIAEADNFVLDELFRAFDLIESYAVSGKEAARRGDREEIKLRLRVQLRDVFRYAVEIHNMLEPVRT